MVDLPKIPRRLVVSEAPRSGLSGADIAGPHQILARNLAELGQAATAISVPLAEQAGVESVVRDEEGNLKIERGFLPMVGKAGEAFENKSMATYLANVEPEIKTKLTELRLANPNDPEGFRQAADSYIETVTGNVPSPMLRQSVRKIATDTAGQHYRSVMVQTDNTNRQNYYTSQTARLEDLNNEASNLARQGGTGLPEYKQIIGEIRSIYTDLGKDPRNGFPPERIGRDLTRMASEHEMEMVIGQGLRMAEKDPEGARKYIEEVARDSRLNLKPSQRDTLVTKFNAMVNQRARAEDQADRRIAGEIKAISDITAKGERPTNERMAAVDRAVNENQNPGVKSYWEATKAAMPMVAAWRQMSPAQLEASLDNMDRVMRERGADENSIALRDTGRKLLGTMRKEIEKDLLGWAERAGVASLPQIDFASEGATVEMRSRIAGAEAVARHYGIQPTYLRPEEKRVIETATEAGGNAMLGMARTLVDGFGDHSSRVLAEVSKDAPVLAHMGGLLSGGLFGGGSETFARDVADGVRLRQDKDFKLPKSLDNAKTTEMQTPRRTEQYGDAFVLVPENGRAAEASAQAAFLSRANRRGIDPTDDVGLKAYDRTLQEAAGATFTPDGVQYGGVTSYKPGYWTNYKTLVPGNVRTDRFKEVIGAVRDDDLSKMPISPEAAPGKPYKASDIQNAVPVAVPGGYRFAAGDPTSDDQKWLRGADGRPFVLNIEAMEPELRRRVPGAFQGVR